jgi:hypothetical protein
VPVHLRPTAEPSVQFLAGVGQDERMRTVPLVASNDVQLDDNLGALAVGLSPQQLATLDARA